MDEAIVKQWNSQVKPEDEVYFLGDFGINKKKALDAELVGRLNGKKYIILGNHDTGFIRMHENKGLESIYNQYIKAGWEDVTVHKVLDIKNGTTVHMTHLPPCNDEDNRYSHLKIKNDPNAFHLNGHLRS
jgi:calcineurin-like phosphoesterase family protein